MRGFNSNIIWDGRKSQSMQEIVKSALIDRIKENSHNERVSVYSNKIYGRIWDHALAYDRDNYNIIEKFWAWGPYEIYSISRKTQAKRIIKYLNMHKKQIIFLNNFFDAAISPFDSETRLWSDVMSELLFKIDKEIEQIKSKKMLKIHEWFFGKGF